MGKQIAYELCEKHHLKVNRLDRRTFLKKIGLAAVSAGTLFESASCVSSSGRSATNKRSNIVFIFIDDLGYKDLGCYGSRYYETPHIDKLAGQGMRFTSAYSNAPNCAPTRACLISGQYTPRHGVYTVNSPERGKARLRKLIPIKNKTNLDSKVVTIAQALKAAGYRTACIGKWHLGDKPPYRPEDRGFDVVFRRTRRSHFMPDGRYLTDVLTDESLKFMEQNRDKPFFLYLSHHTVHTPIQAKEELIEKYKQKKPVGGHNNPAYAAMIESMDQSVGAVCAKLDELKLSDNTIVFFFSDNGGYANATSMVPLRGSKGMLYEGGIRVPMIARWPGRIKPGISCDVPVIGIDFYPTFLEIAGATKPAGYVLDGVSLVPLLTRRENLKRKAIFWHFPAYLEPYNDSQWPWRTTPASAIRHGDWKLIEFFEDGNIELYNLKNDISETKNLVKTNPEKTKELHMMLVEWRKSINAPVPTEKNPRYDPAARVRKKRS